MINSMQEIKERFEKIKDHKPKAAKKLNELGDILSSAYMQDSAIANEMWQYIVDLNTADDIANSKFYVAQVFNKLSDRLSPEVATCFLTMAPERVHQLVLHGVEPFAYLQHVLVQLPYLGKTHSHEELETLMPWAPYIQQNFAMKNSNAYTNCYLD